MNAPFSPPTAASTADSTTAKLRNQVLAALVKAQGTNTDAVVAAIDAITAAFTASIIGGTTGITANRVLVSKGTTGFVLQATPVSIDPVTGNINANGGDLTVDDITADDIAAQDGAFSATLTLNSVAVATLNTNTYAQQQGFTTATLTDAASISWNLQTQQTAKVTLGGNRTLAAPSNMLDGYTYILRVIQDGTGSRALAYSAVFKWAGGVAPVLSTAANAIDILTFVSDGTNMYGAIQKAFA